MPVPPRLGRGVAGFALVDRATLLFFEATDGASFVGLGVADQAVDLAALVVVGEMLGDGKTFLIAEEQSMAVLPSLHLFTGADPGGGLDLLLLVFVEVARTEGTSQLIDVLGEPDNEKLCDFLPRMQM